jgi:ABC-2 type transport system ATP-binding protein
VEQICDRVGIIRQGSLVAVEDMKSLSERRIRQIQFNFSEPVSQELFASLPNVRVLKHTEKSIHLEVIGAIDPVIKEAARHHVDSIESTQTSLEDVFMAYYRTSPTKSPEERIPDE